MPIDNHVSLGVLKWRLCFVDIFFLIGNKSFIDKKSAMCLR